VIDVSGVVDDDYAKFTASGLEGRSFSETKTDLSLNAVENTALSTWAGTSNVTTLGTIGSLVATTADINGGTFDGIVGGTTAADGSFTTLSTSGVATLANMDGIIGAATPAALTCTTFTSTGIDDNAAGAIAITINSDEEVGIGTATPAKQLHITKSAVADIVGLTDAANISSDFDTGQNFSVTLAGNRTLDNPTNITAGQTGSIFITQDGTGSRTLAYGSYWDFAAGTAPTITTTAAAVDRIDYVVRSATSIQAVATLAYS